MAESLAAFVAKTADVPFRWGRCDCTLWVADWCVVRFGYDPAASIRGTYQDEFGGRLLYGDDLAGFVAPFLDTHLRRKQTPCSGDIAVIRAFGSEVSAIFEEPFWVAKTEAGLVHVRARAIMIWGK